MIKWLSKLPLFKAVYRQGGIDSFALAQKDILETMADDLEARAEVLAKQKVNDLYSVVDFNSFITADKSKNVYLQGVLVEPQARANLVAEADYIATSEVWKILSETPKELAHKAMFVSGETLADMQKGRTMLYTLQAQQNILDILLAK